MASDRVIELVDVRARRPGSLFELKVAALNVKGGEFVAIRGKSGAGKSTLLDLMAGLLVANSGRVEVLGLDLRSRSGRNRVRRTGSYLSQGGTCLPYLTVLENVLMAGSLAGLKRDFERARETIELLGLGDFEDARAEVLSGGQRQRASLAGALYRRSPLLWADEPTSALDASNSDVVFMRLREAALSEGAAVVCVSHDIDRCQSYASRWIEVVDGDVHV